MNKNMRISQKGVELIKKFEGVRLTAYQDIVGVWTIGYGHTKGVYQGMTITQKQAEDFLKSDIESHVSVMKQLITVDINQNQFDALSSFHFNLGPNILKGTTLLQLINGKQWEAAAEEMKLYRNAGGVVIQGLVNRRKAETDLFLTPVTENEKPSQTGGKLNMKTLILNDNVYLRTSASTNGKSIALMKKGDKIEFNDLVLAQGYIWAVQPRSDGSKGYIVIGKITPYGSIK